jgi:hypothetical protein
MASGLLGYAWAVASNSAGASTFVQAGFIALVLQTLLTSIASNKKDKFVRKWVKREKHLRSSISASLSAITTVAALFTLILFKVLGLRNDFPLYFMMFSMAIYFQLLSFSKSSQQQIQDLRKFWLIQLSGAIARVFSVSVLVVFWDLSFFGLIASNVISSVIIAALYGSLAISPSTIARDIKVSYANWTILISLDGFLRAIRITYEQQIIFLSVIIYDLSTSGFQNDRSQAAYVSTGFMNAMSTALRQVFAHQERECLFGRQSFSSIIFTSAVCFSIAMTLWWLPYTPYFEKYAPHYIESTDATYVVRSLAIAALLHPVTIGFSFVDYLRPYQIRRFTAVLAASALFFAMSIFIFGLISPRLPPNIFNLPICAAASGTTIGITLLIMKVSNAIKCGNWRNYGGIYGL